MAAAAPASLTALFSYDPGTHVPTITIEGPVAEEESSWAGLKSLYR